MPSLREEVANELVNTCIFACLDEAYGVSKTKNELNGKSFWAITFAKAGTLDGVIRVYSPTFIQVKWDGSHAKCVGLPFMGSKILKSEHEAKRFLIRNFMSV